MILNFKTRWPWKNFVGDNLTRFVEKIADGTKKHTMREDKKNRWKPGNKIHMCTGPRFKKDRCFNNSHTVISTQKVRILRCISGPRIFIVKIDGRVLTPGETGMLAKNDGFDMTSDFYRFFMPNGVNRKVLKLIHWTNLKY